MGFDVSEVWCVNIVVSVVVDSPGGISFDIDDGSDMSSSDDLFMVWMMENMWVYF